MRDYTNFNEQTLYHSKPDIISHDLQQLLMKVLNKHAPKKQIQVKSKVKNGVSKTNHRMY